MREIEKLLEKIKAGEIAPLYLLYGSEEYLQEKVILELKKALVPAESSAFNLNELAGDIGIKELVDLANTLPLFAPKRLIVVRDSTLLQRKKGEQENAAEFKLLEDYLANPLDSTCLVFWQTGNVSKQRKLYRQLVKNKHLLIEFKPLRGQKLNKWLLETAQNMGKTLEQQAANYLIFNHGECLRDLVNELEKLVLYSDQAKVIDLKMTQTLVAQSFESNIFDLVDALGAKNKVMALKELRKLLLMKELPVKILFMITRQIRLILLVKDFLQQGWEMKEIINKLALHPFVAGKIRRQVSNFSFSELENSLILLREYDLKLKSGYDPDLTLENLIIRLAT